MFQSHPQLRTPDPSTVLWRYLDLAKLLFLFEHQALWFSRLDTLGDPYEGLTPRPLIDQMWSHAQAVPEAERPERLRIARHNTRALGMGRDILAVSCWHESTIESFAMWSLYARMGDGIAIRTTLDRLQRSLTAETPNVYGGMVQYVDFESHELSSPLNIFDWATLKRASYSHEREFRAIVMGETGPLTAGVAISMAVDTLIEAVYVAPAAPPWFAALVERLSRKFAVSAPVCQSSLLTHPAYMHREEGEVNGRADP